MYARLFEAKLKRIKRETFCYRSRLSVLINHTKREGKATTNLGTLKLSPNCLSHPWELNGC